MNIRAEWPHQEASRSQMQNNLEELKRKTIDKFKLKFSPGQINFQTPDGTIIENEEYFQTLPPQTLLIWVKKGEKAETDAEILYKTIREVNDEYLTAGEKVQEFFTEKMKNKVFKLAEVLKGIDGEKTRLITRAEHPEWFEGLDTNAKTKEEYMFRRAQDRIRMYFYKTKEELQKTKDLPQAQLQSLINDLRHRLKLNKYHGCYFDRTRSGDENMKSICDRAGWFTCDGRWDKQWCLYNPPHRINPYSSREARIIFQTWNLDHGRERSRSIIPAIVGALRALGDPSADNGKVRTNFHDDNSISKVSVDVKGIYNDLFTVNNLKFVHIVCHDKGAHITLKAGPYFI
ncbi:hypothetical protein NQ317_012614 [Molorchus minor]|uniref:CIDE-N domain-containing protein n=1 Tax=Molorchus minor TaxID=1323400 RepID=A0ABQ9JJ58_9CUCU|nr:hypothetical protein NQ317_012614 [Molorchus minor]